MIVIVMGTDSSTVDTDKGKKKANDGLDAMIVFPDDYDINGWAPGGTDEEEASCYEFITVTRDSLAPSKRLWIRLLSMVLCTLQYYLDALVRWSYGLLLASNTYRRDHRSCLFERTERSEDRCLVRFPMIPWPTTSWTGVLPNPYRPITHLVF